MKINFTVNPITKKRIQRFKNIKRAYWSFWALAITYLISLFANFYCSNEPILMQFNDRYYYPILFNYYKNQFDEKENNTPVDYKELQSSQLFTANKNNFMVFPPIPYGPTENIPISNLSLSRNITLNISLEPKLGSLDINDDLTIRKAESSEFFFEENQTFKKLPLSDFMILDESLKKGIEDRFSNIHSDEFSKEYVFNKKNILIKMFVFEPDENKPSKVRLQLSNNERPQDAAELIQKIDYDEKANPIKEKPKIIEKLSVEQQNEIHQKLLDRAKNYVDPIYLTVGLDVWKFAFERTEAFYPYPPNWNHPFGFDESGRDVLSQVIYGYRIAFSFGIILVIATLVIGVVVGAIQGYFGGKVDLLGQRLIEIWSALPFLYIMIYLGNIFGKSFVLLLIVYGIFNWIGISYYIRADFFKLRKTSYVEAAKCLGISDVKIMWRHILPNALVSITTFFPFMLIGAIGSLAALDYLGFGLPAETPSWGVLLAQGHAHKNAWWLTLFPSLALFFVMLLGTLVGDGLRAAFDPRKFHKIE